MLALIEKHWWISFWIVYWFFAFIYMYGTAPGASRTMEIAWTITKWVGGTILFIVCVTGSYGLFF
jgi:cytochrome b561